MPASPGAHSGTGPLWTEGSDLGTSLDAYLRERARGGYSGVVLVAKDGEVVLRGAYSRDRSVTPETAFWIGSVSKTLTAAAALRLSEDGRLSLSDSLGRFFPDIPEDKRGITVRHLLTHTAGLGEHYAADGLVDRDDAVRALLANPLRRPPGSGYGYSNDAYNLLAALVEVASGQPFEMYLREQVIAPAGMTHTGFWGVPDPVASLAPTARHRAPAPNWGYRGATGVRSTVDDLYRWHLALLHDAVLSEGTRDEAFAPQVEKPNGGAYGYGWQVARTPRGTRLLAHGGAETGPRHYASLYRYVDEGVVVIALSNAREREAHETFGGLLRVLFTP